MGSGAGGQGGGWISNLSADTEPERLARLGHGPTESLLQDDSVSEIMVNGPDHVWLEREGRLHKTSIRFSDDHHLRRIIIKIVGQVG